VGGKRTIAAFFFSSLPGASKTLRQGFATLLSKGGLLRGISFIDPPPDLGELGPAELAEVSRAAIG
jgi:hypothetical protein